MGTLELHGVSQPKLSLVVVAQQVWMFLSCLYIDQEVMGLA